jgi:hypothetical protein
LVCHGIEFDTSQDAPAPICSFDQTQAIRKSSMVKALFREKKIPD